MVIGELTAFSPAVSVNGQVHIRSSRVGRPSTVAPYAPQIAQWLREDPALSGADLLRRVRVSGYHGGKSALYELVRRLRLSASGN
jgi:hypothetical protein